MSAAPANTVGPLDVILSIQFGRKPQRARGNRAPPEADVGAVDQAEVSGHVNSDYPLAFRAFGVVDAFPLLQEGINFLPIITSL